MNALIRPTEVTPQAVPMTVTALRVLDDNGFFDGDDSQHELIDGVLVVTPLPGSSHFFVESRSNRAFNKALINCGLFETHCVQTGGSFQIGDLTLLGPDMMIIPIPDRPKNLMASDIVTLIEIAWTSRANDLGPKASRYAAAGIEDYWVLDVAAKSVIVHRKPEDGVYLSVQTLHAPEKITCLTLPELFVAVADLF